MDTHVNEILQKALEERKRLEVEKELSKKSFDENSFIKIETVGLEQGVEKVGRIVGLPFEVRKNNYDTKLILVSYIVRQDKKGYHKVIWKYKLKNGVYVPDDEWILTRLYNKIMEGRWVKYSEGVLKDEHGKLYPPTYVDEKGKNGKWVRFFENTQIYKLIESNSKAGERFPKRFYPSKRIVLNWIDRHDSWCADNKHTKLLVSKRTPYEFVNDKGEKQTIYYQDIGIPFELYNKIFEHCCAINALFEDIDIVITKKDKDYTVYDITDYPKYVSKTAYELGSKNPLTEEEKKFEKYDLDTIYKVTSYRKLRQNLRYLFELCDKELKTNFMNELDKLCIEEEKNALPDDDKDIDDNVDLQIEDALEFFNGETTQNDTTQNSTQQINVVQKRESVRVVQNKQSIPQQKILDYCISLPFWSTLSPQEQEIYISYIETIVDNVPKFKKDDVPACANEHCVFPHTNIYTLVPIEISKCPVCGLVFE